MISEERIAELNEEFPVGAGIDHYDMDGNPIGLGTWTALFSSEVRYLQRTEIEGHVISTVWLGLDHGHGGDGPPLIFETMVFPQQADGSLDSTGETYTDRYSTKEHALEGHEKAIQWVRDNLIDEEDLPLGQV